MMMNDFTLYLYNKQYRDSTVKCHVQNVTNFIQWIEQSGLYEPENIGYNELLQYVQDAQQKQLDVATINLRLGSISRYYEYLKKQGTVDKNPARTLRIKGKAKTVTEQPLQHAALEQLYYSYKALQKESLHQHKTDLAHQRNIIITGLLVWQGVHSGELEKMETSHINLQEGMIYIPSTARGNSRELRLHAQQVLTLHHYLHGGIREQLKPEADRLIPGNVHNIINLLTAELKGINPVIKNALHIRSSVILHWLRKHNKRQVQYMAGHKYISSTEKYQQQETDTLTDALTKHHPFG